MSVSRAESEPEEKVGSNADEASAGPPPEPPPLAAKANDLDALRAAVIDAANVGAGLWISYIFVLLYLMVAAGSVTHADLLFESPVRLPFLGVDLPLTAFFTLGPAMFLIVHAYVLLHFIMLAGKVAAFDDELRAQIASLDIRTRLRRQLPSNIFVQYLAGPIDIRDGLIGLMLWLIALISLVIGPVCLLLLFQLQFLPYHDVAITYWQRFAVLIDIIGIWVFWPRIALRKAVTSNDGASLSWMARLQRGLTIACMAMLTASAAILILTIATIPGEFIEGSVPANNWLRRWTGIERMRDALVTGDVNPTTRRPVSLWSNRLVLPGIDVPAHMKFDSEAKIAGVVETASFRGRHLEDAVLIGANLRKVDLSGADLTRAHLQGSDLRQARLGCGVLLPGDTTVGDFCSQLQDARLDGANLQEASLDGASLVRASLADANLERASLRLGVLNDAGLPRSRLRGAFLDQAQLRGANLEYAELQGAVLTHAELQGANLQYARLQAANLTSANLQGAQLSRASLVAAVMKSAQAQGALLHQSDLRAAVLDQAELQGASLRSATLRSASLDQTHLEGVEADGNTDFTGAMLVRAFVWRTDAHVGRWEQTLVSEFRVGPSVKCRTSQSRSHECGWTSDRFRQLDGDLRGLKGMDPSRDALIDRFHQLLDPDRPYERDQETEAGWRSRSEAPPPRDVREAELISAFQEAGCARDGGQYVASALLDRLSGRRGDSPFSPGSPAIARIARTLLSEKCEGALGLARSDLAILRELSDSPSVEGRQ